jgi:hypothetical protein
MKDLWSSKKNCSEGANFVLGHSLSQWSITVILGAVVDTIIDEGDMIVVWIHDSIDHSLSLVYHSDTRAVLVWPVLEVDER